MNNDNRIKIINKSIFVLDLTSDPWRSWNCVQPSLSSRLYCSIYDSAYSWPCIDNTAHCTTLTQTST